MKSNNRASLIIWMVAAYVLCLLPSSFYQWLGSMIVQLRGGDRLIRVSDRMELAAHAVLMGGLALCLMRWLRQRPRKPDRSNPSSLPFLVSVLSVVALVALSIEGLQSLLPESFHRGFSWGDIGFSILGGLAGAVMGLLLATKN